MAWDALQGHEYINMTTYRRSGAPVVTPVWFAQRGARLYVMTIDASGKVKRIRHTMAVDVGPSDRGGKPLGASEPGSARIVSEAEAARVDELLTAKYGMLKRVFDAANSLRRSKRVFIEIEPRNNDNPGTASA